jgi:hypothetical protein
MRILTKLSFAIALAASSLGVTGAASAQSHDNRINSRAEYNRDVLGIPGGANPNYRRADRRDDRRDYRRDRRNDDRRSYRANRRGDDRRGYNRGRDCRTVWRNQRRVRICR